MMFSKVKVLQITKHYPPCPGGIESVTHDLTVGLAERGIYVEVLCCNNVNKTELDCSFSYPVKRVARLFKAFSTSIAPSLIYNLWVVRSEFDIVHVHFPDPMSALAIFICRPKSKIVVHWHSDIIKQKKILKLFLPLQNWILKRADRIIGTSPVYISESQQLRSVREKCVAIPIGIKRDRMNVSTDVTLQFKREFPSKRLVFGLGRLVYYKGFQYLIEASAFLPDDVLVLIGGDGELRSELQQAIKSSHLENKVKLLGRLSDEEVYSLLSISSVFCFPSTEKSEAFGVVQLEAMALGVPIVATNIRGSGVPWVNKHGETGFNVPIMDSRALASAINEILKDSELAKTFGDNGRARFSEHFEQTSMISAVSNLYDEMLRLNP